ncbi:MAG: YbaB/EbfC family nucleoid-associated protein [Terriglobales bacterium]
MSFDLGQMQAALSQAKRQYEEMRGKMAQISEEANAGAGMVWVRVSGEKQVLEVKLDPEVVKNDPDMLPELIRAAVNEAGRKVDARLQQEFRSMVGGGFAGLPLPGLF